MGILVGNFLGLLKKLTFDPHLAKGTSFKNVLPGNEKAELQSPTDC